MENRIILYVACNETYWSGLLLCHTGSIYGYIINKAVSVVSPSRTPAYDQSTRPRLSLCSCASFARCVLVATTANRGGLCSTPHRCHLLHDSLLGQRQAHRERQTVWMDSLQQRVGVTSKAVSNMKDLKMSAMSGPIKIQPRSCD
ncbi:ABC transporter [Colletotrichum graminicola]|nr:ABC transporter [Colletotrichum graminicola]